MITGVFDSRRRPRLEGILEIPSLGVAGRVPFLVDTGAGTSTIHPEDAFLLQIPFSRLKERANFRGIGGVQSYYVVDGSLLFEDGDHLRGYRLRIGVAQPTQQNQRLPSLLGQDVLQFWRMVHDPLAQRLDFAARRSDILLTS